MKLRLTPLLISLICSVAVLFGGWHMYQSYALESPFTDEIQQLDGVASSEVEISKDTAVILITLDKHANYRQVVKQIEQSSADYMANKNLKIIVDNPSSEELDRWWSSILFKMAEVMENKQYGEIPALLEQDKLSGLEIHTEIDESHVYIQLAYQDDLKFIRLPRQPVMLGVWNNE